MNVSWFFKYSAIYTSILFSCFIRSKNVQSFFFPCCSYYWNVSLHIHTRIGKFITAQQFPFSTMKLAFYTQFVIITIIRQNQNEAEQCQAYGKCLNNEVENESRWYRDSARACIESIYHQNNCELLLKVEKRSNGNDADNADGGRCYSHCNVRIEIRIWICVNEYEYEFGKTVSTMDWVTSCLHSWMGNLL